MSNRAVREGVVEVGHQARVGGVDPLRMRSIWTPSGIVRDSLMMARADIRDEEPERRKNAAQWFAYFKTMR